MDGSLECPFHGFQYDPAGRCRLIPALGKSASVEDRFRLQTMPARDAHGLIWIFWGEDAPEDLPEIPFFEDLGPGFSHATFQDPWPVHYSRAIENQLDVMHLPFVHANTIGRGSRTVVDGPIVEWQGQDRFRFYVHNRADDGTPARRPEELDPQDAAIHLDFVFPNLWQNYLSDSLRIVAAFAPVDEDHTIVYIRHYQKMVRIPGLRELFDFVMMQFNRIVLHQDRRVVSTQIPVATSLKMGEQLVRGDLPIVAYRQRRHELIEAARGDTDRA